MNNNRLKLLSYNLIKTTFGLSCYLTKVVNVHNLVQQVYPCRFWTTLYHDQMDSKLKTNIFLFLELYIISFPKGCNMWQIKTNRFVFCAMEYG